MDLANPALGFLAGLLSILSPCVLPLVPIVVGSAMSEHRWGVVALAAGVALSFLCVGLFVATIGFSIGLDEGVFRAGAAIIMMMFGVVLLVPAFQNRLAVAAGPIGNWAEQHSAGYLPRGPAGQFGIGALLGVTWAPCVGPTLGAASVLAAQGRDLGAVSLTMLLFAIGSVTPLLAVGLLSREALVRWRGRMAAAGSLGKVSLGIVLLIVGASILSGLDKTIETALVDRLPQWMLDLATRY
jgi:cytochrome c-type biogenesis protein